MTASTDIIWIKGGAPIREHPEYEGRPASDEVMIHRLGALRVTSGAFGTEIRWATFAPCFASALFVADWLRELPGPYMLRYFLMGWFEERHETAAAARRRILDIVARGDIHLMRRVFIRPFEPIVAKMPKLLHDVWIDGKADPKTSVDCVYEGSSGRFRVDRIGAHSNLAKLWGLAPVSYPCSNGNSYGRAVSEAYAEVVKSGRPRYDHVYAAMETPDGNVVWIPYQRVIMPMFRSKVLSGVSVVTEVANVGITIV